MKDQALHIRLHGFRAILLLFITAIITLPVFGQNYIPQDAQSKVKFKVVNHLIGRSTVTGSLKGLKGKIVFNPNAPATSSFDVSVNPGTVHTGIGMRDKDLKKSRFFNADKFPAVTIKSTSVTKGKNANSYVLHGTVMMKGVSKPVSIPFTASPANGGYTFKGTFQLKRNDFNVGTDEPKIDDQVTVSLSVFAKKG